MTTQQQGTRGGAGGTRPALSLHERDRRFELVHALLERERLDAVLIGGFRGREAYEAFVTDDYVEGVVLFPADGEPTALSWTGSRISRAYESFRRGEDRWVNDWRGSCTGPAVAALIQEKRLARGRVGVVGLETRGPGEFEGFIPATFWNRLTAALPDLEWVEVSSGFAEMMLVKSDEELAVIRYASAVAENACRRMLEVTRPGVGEREIYAEVMDEIIRAGASARYPTLILHSGPSNISWGPPRWLTRAEQPRRVERGDMVQAEIFPTYANQEIQIQMSIALDPVDETNLKCEQVARASYEAGLETLRPGISFAELVQAMEEPLRESGCWAKTPLVHSLGPLSWIGGTRVNMEQLEGTEEGQAEAGIPVIGGDLEIQAGMTFAFEPNACLDTHRVNIGGSLIVTESGCEELNDVPTRVNHVS